MKTISVNECLHMDKVIFIDVRTKKEYEEGTITGAINIPIFDNEQRAILGHTYKNVSKTTAKEMGFEIASHKLPEIYSEIKKVSKGYSKIVIFCWRGGMRSKSIATVMDLMHLPAYQLEGGYKAYRKHILNYFDKKLPAPSPYIVLHGYTGCGKTLLLNALEKANMPVLDLEGLANHRGSVFGGVGLSEQPPQKVFESLIYDKTKEHENTPIFVEAESTKVGKRMVPAFAMNYIKTGIHILVNLDKDIRIKRLIDDYIGSAQYHAQNFSEIRKSLTLIKSYMSNEDYNKMQNYLDNGNIYEFVSLLLDNYYDPMYEKWKKLYETFDYEVDSANVDAAVNNLIKIYNSELNNFKKLTN
ncbi:MAG: tRNA 2-selenouridine(34) synthase MnmH [Vallitalea sp.]|jgi:tRNA 2-selenouridine synthase|nr:tRNA 2-selenouridine(34) synthase MnmH [Vallitalea sp.]